jgi:hypothetical protein
MALGGATRLWIYWGELMELANAEGQEEGGMCDVNVVKAASLSRFV